VPVRPFLKRADIVGQNFKDVLMMDYTQYPDARGHFGPYGGIFAPETLMQPLAELTQAYAKYRVDPQFLAEFEAGQIYQFKIQSADSNNNLSISKVYTILAPKQKESVFQVIMKNFEDVFGWTQNLNR
jgi:hypothetical protein